MAVKILRWCVSALFGETDDRATNDAGDGSLCKVCPTPCCLLPVEIMDDETDAFPFVEQDGSKLLTGTHLPEEVRRCPYQGEDGRCRLEYQSRPFACRLYPILFKKKRNGRIVPYIDSDCAYSKVFRLRSEESQRLVNEARERGFDKYMAETFG